MVQRARRVSPLPLLLSLLATAVSAVSLSSFSPYASNLSPSCAAVYTATIPGCTSADFSGSSGCSSACLQGLVQTSTEVYESCTATRDYQLLIAQFLNGNGITVLCPGVVVVTAQSGTAVPPQQTSYTARAEGTTTLKSGPVDTSSLIVDTSAAPCVYPSSCTNTAAHHTGKPSHTRQHTTTHPTRTSSTTHITYAPNSPQRTSITRTGKPSRTTSSATTTAFQPIASASHCVAYGGDPFSNCPSSNSHNAAPSPRTSPSGAALFSVFGAILYLAFLTAQ